jgi:ABC-2 type transport system permease protein
MISALTKINGYNPTKALFLKEFWDHRRAILMTPMVITGLFIVFVIVAMVTGNDLWINDMSLQESMRAGFIEAREEGQSPSFIVTRMLFGFSVLLWIAAAFTITFTALSSLHDERKDGSILFWKSMPVSDAKEVLIRLATIIFVIPLVIVPFAIIIELFMVMAMTVIGLYHGIDVVSYIYMNINVPVLMMLNIVLPIMTVLWILPLITWFMLVSSFSRRPPFLIAFAVPALIIATEEIFFEGSLLLEAIVSFAVSMGGNFGQGTFFALSSFTEPALYIGFAISAAMIYGCIYFRKRHTLT